jgi:serine protease Do
MKMMRNAGFVLVALMMVLASVARAALPEFTELVKKTSPAVVNISATRSREENFQPDQQNVPEFFRRFFPDMPGRQSPTPAAGSGFIISEDGYILTNNHVIDKADEIIVALSDRRERVAEVVGVDALSDLALLKIDAKGLPKVEVGSSEKLQVGEWVVAIGSPFGFELSVTAGIVSAKGRSLPGMYNDNYVPYIQSDVAINPGNSGGPLFDLDGKVVGINSQIFTRSGGFMGLSFSIPIDVAMEVVEQLKDKGSVSRGWLGVVIQRVDRDLAESFGMDRPEGALISDVLADSPAEKGGLQVGDVIVEFAGKKIDLSSDLPLVVGRTRAESDAKVVVVREGKKRTIKMQVGTLPERDLRQLSRRGGQESPGYNRLGIDVVDLEPAELRRLGVDRGVMVRRISGGPASDAGIRRGDVITTLNNEWVSDRDEFETMVTALPTNVAIAVRIVREQRSEYLVLKIPD